MVCLWTLIDVCRACAKICVASGNVYARLMHTVHKWQGQLLTHQHGAAM